jgi:hypothetical protein
MQSETPAVVDNPASPKIAPLHVSAVLGYLQVPKWLGFSVFYALGVRVVDSSGALTALQHMQRLTCSSIPPLFSTSPLGCEARK